MIEYVTNDQLAEMVRAQEILNKKYNGDDWRKSVRLGWAKMAMLVEVAEMADELKPSWAWWKSNVVGMDWNKAKFEFIDVLHFAMLLALYRNEEDTLCLYVKHSEPDMGGAVGDPHNAFIKAITRFLWAVDNDDIVRIASGLRNIIQTGALLVCMGPGEVYKAYQLKNAVNHKRVEGGVMEGKYDKSQEPELKL